MRTLDLIEIQKDSTYTFTHFIESKNTAIIPTTAKITIVKANGDTVLSQTDMVIDGVTGVCTYAWDSTNVDVGRNYMVKYDLDSYNPVVRLFDIMLYPFVNNVTDTDLFAEYSGLKSNMYEDSSFSQSGTVNTIVDNNRAENNDHWNGGQVEIFQNQKVYVRNITDYNLATSTITFSPDMTTAITNENYTIRQSFQEDIDNAGVRVQKYFKTLNKRAYLVIDPYTLNTLIVYEVMKSYFFQLIKDNNDEFSIKYHHYADLYKSEIESMKLVYDDDSDGIIDDGEEDQSIGQVTFYR